MLFCKPAFQIKEVYRTEQSLEARVPWSKQLQSLIYKKQQGGEDVAKGIESERQKNKKERLCIKQLPFTLPEPS
jgi:hypothetical protein